MDPKIKLPNFQENILLANHTTFRIGGPAKYFLVAREQAELVAAIRWAKEKGEPYYLLGGGSNLLINDEGYEGLIIKCQTPSIKCQNENNKLKIICDAGVSFNRVILETSKSGFSGVEWGFGIPGTIGGAICGNAGRLGQDIAPVVESVKILNNNLDEEEINGEVCGFGYRESRFKQTGEIILAATLVFEKGDQSAINETLNEARAVIRKSPPYPSAGCVFKNYKLKNDQDDLLKNHPELLARVRGNKIGVGYLIEQGGLKGKKIGGAQIWDGHANYIVNIGGAKAADVAELIKIVREAVTEKYNVELEEEIRRVG